MLLLGGCGQRAAESAPAAMPWPSHAPEATPFVRCREEAKLQHLEEEARELYPVSFSIPEGAENVGWSVMEAEGAAPLLQLMFDLNDNAFTAREQKTDDGEADIAGMYYTWTDQREEALKNWADGKLTAKLSRFMGENEWADLCTWYDPETGVSYSLSVAAEDLDGFDLLALAEQLRP